ncbi:DegT/DnrJ/EryC1/StrS family aminotransferase [Lentzea sp. JNUCC 0626]|uniref:DegT/DnrJ/EryC1/StrS family aminotransferase n=1 Tax=Lentzea sp. JNUCC 0626 TaxID=3367513 RepID=UPI00374A6A18
MKAGIAPDTSAIAPWASAAAQERLRGLENAHDERASAYVTSAVTETIARHRRRADDTGIPLYAGTNVLSPNVLAAHDTGLSTRPALGWPGEKLQTGTQDIEHLEVVAMQQVARSLRARYAEVRFVTATMANLATYIAFAEPGDTIAVLSPEAGGHASHQGAAGTAGVRGLKVEHLPYSAGAFDVDVSAVEEFVRSVRPRIILVGGSVTLFPHNLEPIKAAARKIGAVVVYDASHTAGLIAAGLFQDPLAEGADVVTFSTYKTYGGPAGGAAVTNDPELAERLSHAAYPVLLSNYDPARLGPLAIAASEAVEQSPAWAVPTTEYAAELAARLDFAGLAVAGRGRHYSRTHQVVLDVGSFGGGPDVVRRLEGDGIHAGACRLPWQHPAAPPQGVRLGSQEFVRRGAGFDSIPELAELVARSVMGPDRVPDPGAAHRLRARITRDLWGRPGGAAQLRDERPL